MARVIPAIRPDLAHLAARAGHTLGFPIASKRRDVKALPGLRLPRRIHLNRPNHFNTMGVLTIAQDLGGDVAPIQQRFRRQQVFPDSIGFRGW